MTFLDLAQVHIRSGSGGAGCVAFRREKHLEFGGPDGGDGGRGGDVRVEVAPGLNTLVDFRYRPHVFAKNGQSGMGKGRTGRSGAEAVLRVPPGTEILEDDRETVIADLTKAGDSVVLAQGGNGGFGNLHFRTATNQAPRRANPGQPGVERTLWLRLKLIADAGLVGLPNAGKSTFLAAVSNARPRVADYPFTTLQPNLGVAAVDDSELVIADLPGLIEGAHTGRGIGDRFLGHVERAPVLLHLVDATAEAPLADYRTVEAELAHHSDRHADKPRVTALTKTDAVPAGTTADLCAELSAAAGAEVHAISAVSGAGVAEVLRALRTAIEAAPKDAHADDAEPAPWRP